MTEKKISDFILFFCKIATYPPPPYPKKSYPLISSNSPLKFEVLSSIPFLKSWQEVQPPPPPERGGGGRVVHYIF